MVLVCPASVHFGEGAELLLEDGSSAGLEMKVQEVVSEENSYSMVSIRFASRQEHDLLFGGEKQFGISKMRFDGEDKLLDFYMFLIDNDDGIERPA